jgi:hypothetical protein
MNAWMSPPLDIARPICTGTVAPFAPFGGLEAWGPPLGEGGNALCEFLAAHCDVDELL